jgi:4,4'-diaponeurosporenoate glycosyltransferase
MLGLRTAILGLLCVLGLLLMWKVLFRDRSSAGDWSAGRRTPISVVIPARNEGHQIGRLLRSLDGQTVKPCEVIVVDDDSSDDTGVVAREEGALVIGGTPPPEGWNGKAWACWQGACASTGDMLLFLDADTWLEPEGIEWLLGLHEGSGLLTVQPYHVTEDPYEQLSAFFNIVVMAAVGAFTPFGDRLKPGGAFGPCVMCRRDEYFRTGGHRAVGGELLEDIPLAKLFLRHGSPVRCYAGQGIISFRMYRGGLRELVEGWTKGMGYGAFSVNPAFSIMTAAWIAGCFEAFSALTRAITSSVASPAWTGLIAYFSYALVIGWMLRAIGRFRWWTSALFPIPLCFFAVIVARSLMKTYLLRRVVWKGRAVSLVERRR